MIEIKVTGANASEAAAQIVELSQILAGGQVAKTSEAAPAKEEKAPAKETKPAAEKKADKPAAPAKEEKEEEGPDFLEESKALLVRHSKKGKTKDMKAILGHVGVQKLTDANADQLEELHALFTKYDKLAKTGEVDLSDLGIETEDDLV